MIGRALIDEFAAHDAAVIVISRNPHLRAGIPEKVRIAGWDIEGSGDDRDVWEDAAAVINLAGESIAGDSLFSLRWTAERKRAILESRLKAGAQVVRAVQAVSQKPKAIIQASAVGYYGTAGGDEALDETAAAGDDFLAEVCQAWEASTKAVEEMGIRRVVIRIGVVLSRAGGALPRQALPFRLFVGGSLGDGRQWISWIHIRDLAATVRFLSEQAHCRGVFNLTAPQPVTNAEFSAALGKALHRPSRISVPAFILRLFFAEGASVLLEGQQVIPQRLADLDFRFRYPTIHEALMNLG